MKRMLFWGQYLIWLILLLGRLHGCESCVEKEREALLELKNDLMSIRIGSDVLPTWINDTKSNCCQWEGIECNHTSRRVMGLYYDGQMFYMESYPLNLFLLHPFEEIRSLNLTRIGYNGFFDDIEGYKSLSRLRNLEILDLSGNDFDSRIFPFLNAATSLTSLSLRANLMGGPLSFKELKDLTNLELLDLSANSLNGSMLDGLTHLKKLKALVIRSSLLSSLSALKDLTNLEMLDLAGNELKGSMLELTHLKQLKFLKLSNNGISSLTELQVLNNLNNLEVLDLAWNQLDGPIPIEVICEMKNLQELDLRGNSFVGQLPLCLGGLSKLRVLDISNNQLSRNLPSSFSSLGSLEYLSLSNNNFSGSFSLNPLTNSTKLKVFKLSSRSRAIQVKTESTWQPNFHLSVVKLRFCSLEKIPSFLEYQKKLHLVDLSCNSLSGKIPTWLLMNNPELEVLLLQNNSFITFEMPTIVHNLQVLDFSANEIGMFPDNTGLGLPNLKHMNGSNNGFQGNFPSSMDHMKNLSLLDLSYNNFSGDLPRSCFSLKILILSHNRFSGSCLPTRTSFSSAQVLRMDNNLFTGKIGVGLRSANNTLRVLDMSNNSLTGAIPSWISKFSSLKVLMISNNFLEGSIPKHLCNLSNVRLLDLSDNHLDGVIPSCLYNLSFGLGGDEDMFNDFQNIAYFPFPFQREFYKSTFVVEEFTVNYYMSKEIEIKFASKQRYDTYTGRSLFSEGILGYMSGMDLSNNKLNGIIPRELGNLTKLRALNLSHNFLSSSIPYSFSNLKDIESLDLSHNKLHGSIPQQLTSLTSLAVLDVSYNNLSGIIPQGKQFNTFNENSYIGNPLLCGPLTSRSCEAKKNSEEADNGGGEKDDEAAIDMLVFYYSVASTYVIALIGIIALMCFDSPWLRAWLRIVDAFIASAKHMLLLK